FSSLMESGLWRLLLKEESAIPLVNVWERTNQLCRIPGRFRDSPSLHHNSSKVMKTFKCQCLHRAVFLLIVGARCVMLFATSAVAAANYDRAVESISKTALLPLPPGAIQPAGWLRDWAQAAREGITGHLDEWHPVFADGWKGSRVNAPNAK